MKERKRELERSLEAAEDRVRSSLEAAEDRVRSNLLRRKCKRRVENKHALIVK